MHHMEVMIWKKLGVFLQDVEFPADWWYRELIMFQIRYEYGWLSVMKEWDKIVNIKCSWVIYVIMCIASPYAMCMLLRLWLLTTYLPLTEGFTIYKCKDHIQNLLSLRIISQELRPRPQLQDHATKFMLKNALWEMSVRWYVNWRNVRGLLKSTIEVVLWADTTAEYALFT